ncbi:MAG: TorF family putative porin [Candidatus Delongbacteria bacterium]
MNVLLPLLLLGAVAPLVRADWNGSLGLVSDYVSRGWTQSDGTAAPQAGLGWSHSRGPHVDAWASRVKFPGDDSRAELDLGAGWAGSWVGPALDWDLQLQAILYPGTSGADYPEFLLGVGRESWSAELSWSPDIWASGADGWYLAAERSQGLGDRLSLRGGLGCTRFSRPAAGWLFGSSGSQTLLDGHLALDGRLAGLDLSLVYYDADARTRELAGDQSGRRIVLEILRQFPND